MNQAAARIAVQPERTRTDGVATVVTTARDVRCIRLYAPVAKRKLRFPFNQAETDLFTAVIVSGKYKTTNTKLTKGVG